MGAVLSSAAYVVLVVSTFPALSVELYSIVWFPSVVMEMVVPVCHEPPSILYDVDAHPEVASLHVKVTVKSAFCQPLGASSEVVGGVLSTVTLLVANWFVLSKVSLAVALKVCTPSE